MQRVLNLYKPVGLSPLQLTENFRQQFPEYQNTKLGYAGRLDPMADGVLLLLVDDENKKRKIYESLEKTYSFDCLFGISTDTADTLGVITTTDLIAKEQIMTKLQIVLPAIARQTVQKYPAYSSRTVQGKPLYYWARQNKLSDIVIPDHPIVMYELHLQNTKTISSQDVAAYIFENIKKVEGDFRQNEILSGWESYFKKNKTDFLIASCFVRCSSGTYIRGICEEIGKQVGVSTLALRITRESVGSYMLKDSLRVQ